MRRRIASACAGLLLLAGAPAAFAQLSTEGPVVYGHHHIYTSSIEAQKKFWVDTLGGVDAGNLGPAPVAVVRIPNVHVLLSERVPSGGTIGTSVNHLGFQTPDVRALVGRVREAGYPIVTREELPPAVAVDEDGLAHVANQNTYIAFVMAPDGVKVELFENRSMSGSIALHHVHFAAPDVDAMKAWYANAFGAVPGMRGFVRGRRPAGRQPDVLALRRARQAHPLQGGGPQSVSRSRTWRNSASSSRPRGVALDNECRYAEALELGVAFVTDPLDAHRADRRLDAF